MTGIFYGLTANEVWKDAFTQLRAKSHSVNSRSGKTYEMLHTVFTIEDPRQRWIYDRFPTMSIAFALAELIWIINGDDKSEIINEWNPVLKRYAGKGDRYYGAYGRRIRQHLGFDQLERAYYALQSVPESRQVVIQIYDAKLDMPLDDGKPRSDDIPCNICSMLKIRDDKLEWSQIMRSNDIFRGMPYNFIQFTSLQEILAGWLGLEVGLYSHYCDSLHLYSNDSVRVNNNDIMTNNDVLSINKQDFDILMVDMYKRMKCLCKSNLIEERIAEIGDLNSKYTSYDNIMYIITAYIARKTGFIDLAEEMVAKSSNSLYRSMWKKWIQDRDY